MGSYRIVSHHIKFPGLQLTQFRFYNAKKIWVTIFRYELLNMIVFVS